MTFNEEFINIMCKVFKNNFSKIKKDYTSNLTTNNNYIVAILQNRVLIKRNNFYFWKIEKKIALLITTSQNCKLVKQLLNFWKFTKCSQACLY